MRSSFAAALLAAAVALAAPSSAAAQSAHGRYTSTLARERALRDAAANPTLREIRSVVAAYEQFVRRYRSSGYSDNALWQGAHLALLAYERYAQPVDQRTARRLLKQLRAEYPTSSLNARAQEMLARLETSVAPALPSPARAAVAAVLETPAVVPVPRSVGVVTIRDIKRTALPDGVRVTIEMNGESLYRHERLENPARVFFDLRSARPVSGLQDATLRFEDDLVREIRLGRHPQNTTRVVMDMHDVDSYTVFTLYEPFRLVVDFRRAAAPAAAASFKPDADLPSRPAPNGIGTSSSHVSTAAGTLRNPAIAASDVSLASSTGRATDFDRAKTAASAASPTGLKPEPIVEELPLASRSVTPVGGSPSLPTANSDGRFSLARQLGLGISRIVIDPGHGGHDPGARANGIGEAELVLDVALRLRKLLEKQTAIEVSMTRDTDVFVPLEERTAFANREGADLFLSIHANASVNSRARGVETYFLNFASNPEAEALAARENSASARTMRNLPDIVRAIALNNKINESRDLAGMVQKSMVRRLAPRNRQLKDLGVKQAPFVVLIGASMPSVLAEISFLTNKQESQLLKTSAYRQQIAEALLDAVLRYQQSLKNVRKVAARQP